MTVQVEALDHVTLRVRDLAASLAFYQDTLGMEIADWRPPFTFEGAWLALNGHAIVHLVCRNPGSGDAGSVDHFALRATDLDRTRNELSARQIPYREQVTPDGRFHQIFLADPDGVKIELTFPQEP